jgi:hypothetical protein
MAELKLRHVTWHKYWRLWDNSIGQGFMGSGEDWKALANKDAWFVFLKFTFCYRSHFKKCVYLCFALTALSSKSSLTCHTYCHAGLWFIEFHSKSRSPCPTLTFESATLGTSDLYAAVLTTAPCGRLLNLYFIACNIHLLGYIYFKVNRLC